MPDAQRVEFVPGPLPSGPVAPAAEPARASPGGSERSSSDYFDATSTARAAAEDVADGNAATIGLHGCVLDQERRIAELDVIVRDLRARIEELEATILEQYGMLNDKFSFSLPWKRP